MTLELIPRERRELAPGAVHVPGWLDVTRQRFLVEWCREWAAEGPGIRSAALPNGARMSVRTVCLGWHWIPYRYSRTRDDQDGSPAGLPRRSHDAPARRARRARARAGGGRLNITLRVSGLGD